MELNAIMANQLRSLQSTVQMSVLNNTLNMNKEAVSDMLQNLPVEQSAAHHPYKGASVDVKA